MTASKDSQRNLQTATLGGGCFWCLEAVFNELAGVESVVSGYAGGDVENPSYQEVCTGQTGHAEVVQVKFDADVLTYLELLEVFFQSHDPTTLNRQGNDVGTQYRSVIFTHDDQQQQTADDMIAALSVSEIWSSKLVTQIEPLKTFYPAEAYHQEYFARNAEQPYCQMVIRPKLDKIRAAFSEQVKPGTATARK